MLNVFGRLSSNTKADVAVFILALALAIYQLAFVKKSWAIEWLRDFTTLFGMPLLTGAILARHLNPIWLSPRVEDNIASISIGMLIAYVWLGSRCKRLKAIVPSGPTTDPDAWPPAPQSTTSTDRAD